MGGPWGVLFAGVNFGCCGKGSRRGKGQGQGQGLVLSCRIRLLLQLSGIVTAPISLKMYAIVNHLKTTI